MEEMTYGEVTVITGTPIKKHLDSRIYALLQDEITRIENHKPFKNK